MRDLAYFVSEYMASFYGIWQGTGEGGAASPHTQPSPASAQQIQRAVDDFPGYTRSVMGRASVPLSPGKILKNIIGSFKYDIKITYIINHLKTVSLL